MNTPRRKKNEEAQKEEKKRYKNATTVSARFEDFDLERTTRSPKNLPLLFFSSVSLSGTFFFACLFFSSFSFSVFLSAQLKMSSSGKDFVDTDGRRRDTEKKKATTTTKDALERALSRHEKYVSSSSEGRFAEDLGMPSFFLSLCCTTN